MTAPQTCKMLQVFSKLSVLFCYLCCIKCHFSL